MFKRDLIARYGEGSGVHEKRLKKALQLRAAAFGGIGVVGLGILGLIVMFGGWETLAMTGLVLAGTVVGVAVVIGFIWCIEELPGILDVIREAKRYGVYEDK